MHKDKVLLTGANGLLGSYILRWLLNKGFEVRATYRGGSDMSLVDDIHDKVEWFKGDMTDYAKMEMAMQGCNRVIHSAAVVSYDPGDKGKMIDINVGGTKNLVDIALEQGIDQFIHVSSVAAIGRPRLSTVLDENTPWEDSRYNSVYAESKFQSELETWRGIAEGLDAVILNPSFILGPGDWSRSSTQVFKYVWDEKKFFTEGKLNFVDVRDVVNAVEKAWSGEANGERYIICGGSIRFEELFQKMAKFWGKKAPTVRISKTMAEIAWRFESVRSFITGSKPFITKDSANSATRQYTYDTTKSQSKLGMNYFSIDDTLKWTCQELAKKYG